MDMKEMILAIRKVGDPIFKRLVRGWILKIWKW